MTAKQYMLKLIQQQSWLFLALLCWFFAMIFWFSAQPEQADVVLVEKPKKAETLQALQPQTVAATTDLGMLHKQVNPLKISERYLSSGERAAEFRGTKFIESNKNRWGLELFSSSSEEIAKDFLKTQTDRSPYYYLRLTRTGQADVYVMLYGLYDSQMAAKTAWNTLQDQLRLPLTAQAKKLSDYSAWVNDLGSDEVKPLKPLTAVVLRPTKALPVAVVKPLQNQAAASDPNVTTQTTIVQRNAAGQVVGVDQTTSTVQNSETKTPSQTVSPTPSADMVEPIDPVLQP